MGGHLSKESRPYNPGTPFIDGWQLARLCKACKKISWDDKLHLHQLGYRVQRNARRRHACHVCTLIWGGLGDPDVPYIEGDSFAQRGKLFRTVEIDGGQYFKYEIALFYPTAQADVPYENSLSCKWASRPRDDVRSVGIDHTGVGTAFLVLSYTAQLMIPHPSHHQIERSTNSPTSLGLAKVWYNQCRSSHSMSCISSSKILPTRLLDLGLHETDVPRLVCDLGGTSPGTEYVTLSHCWGDPKVASKFTKLLTTNLKTFQKGIPPTALSKTFRDSIAMAKSFGFRYLWIDSLCIVQDDKEDWLRESAKMGNIYAGSAITIAAAGAKDGDAGLFFERKPTKVRRCIVNFKDTPHSLSRKKCYTECVNDQPLGKRAWVFQERYLSPRTIHFGSSQLLWQCSGNTACEIFPEGLPVFEYSGASKLHQSDLNATLELSDKWCLVIESYSKCHLTQGTDKLIAISGIARRFHERFGGSYLAGMWAENLLPQLEWTIESNHKVKPVYRAPSWSWAAVDGTIRLTSYEMSTKYEEKRLIRVVDVEVIPTSEDNPFGLVLSGNLRLACSPLLKIRLSKMEVNSTKPFYSISIRGQEMRSADIVLDYIPESSSLENCYFLPTTVSNLGALMPGPQLVWGFVLEAVPNMKGQFRRITFDKIEIWSPTLETPSLRNIWILERSSGYRSIDEDLCQHLSGPEDLGYPSFEVAQRMPSSLADESVYESLCKADDGSLEYQIVLI